MRRLTVTCVAIGGALLAAPYATAGFSQMLGDQDFSDGDIVTLAGFNGMAADDPVPFNAFIGSDPGGVDFAASWTFNFAAAAYGSGSITFGIFDHDSAEVGNQVASFSVDGFDLTAQLDALFEASGGGQAEYNIYTLALPAGALASFADGSAIFSLTLSGPSQPGQLPGNGAGIDFSTLTAVPAPGALVLLGMAGLATRRRRR